MGMKLNLVIFFLNENFASKSGWVAGVKAAEDVTLWAGAGLQCWDLSGKFCRWSCWETKNWNIIICFLSAAYGGWSERLQPLPPHLPVPTNLKKWHQKTYFQTKFVLKGYKWGLSICAVSPQSSHKDKKVEISPNLLNILQLRHRERSCLGRAKSSSIFFITSQSTHKRNVYLVSISICFHFILCFSVFRFDENVPYLAFHIPPSKSQCLICGKIFSVWRFL